MDLFCSHVAIFGTTQGNLRLNAEVSASCSSRRRWRPNPQHIIVSVSGKAKDVQEIT